MQHIRFISTNQTICEKPNKLGYDMVVQDYLPDDPQTCGVCSSLLLAFNKRRYENDELIYLAQQHGVQRQPLSTDRKLLILLDVITLLVVVIALIMFYGGFSNG